MGEVLPGEIYPNCHTTGRSAHHHHLQIVGEVLPDDIFIPTVTAGRSAHHHHLQIVCEVLSDDIFIPTVTQLVDLFTTIILYLQSVIYIVHT